tara:strand:- start:100 stop:267 length:168 start_codon:yes stop_codon:yes gene_type:complete
MKKIKINSNVKIIKGNLFQSNYPKVKAGSIIKGKINLKRSSKNLFAKSRKSINDK